MGGKKFQKKSEIKKEYALISFQIYENLLKYGLGVD